MPACSQLLSGWLPTLCYEFVHALYREVFLRRLSPGRRWMLQFDSLEHPLLFADVKPVSALLPTPCHLQIALAQIVSAREFWSKKAS